MINPIARLRTIAIIEGISFLVLLFIAMPLKYFWGQPQAVRIIGMAHGVLFLIFCAALIRVTVIAKWPLGRSALLFLASIIPFGPWLIDRRIKTYEAEFLARK
jgi:integral membrane protein